MEKDADLLSAMATPAEHKHFSSTTNQWLIVVKSLQNLDETLAEIDGNLKNQTTNFPLKIKELFKKDQTNLEESWESLKSNWMSKCREISSLKKSINRLAEEKTRLREENQGMEKSISRLQGQFSQSVNSSLAEIQSLTSANSDLSDQLQKMEGLKTEYSKVREGVQAKLNVLGKRLHESGADKHKLDTILREESTKIDKLLSSIRLDNDLSNDIMETAQKLGNNIEANRMQTLENHLQELEKELIEKNERIRSLEKQNEDFIKERNLVVNDINEEERNWFDYMKRSMMPGKVSQEECLETFEIPYLTKSIRSAKSLCLSTKENLADVYKNTVTNEDELHEVRDSADEMVVKLRATHQKLENSEAEVEYLRRKLDQEDTKLKVSRDEVVSLQGRIHMLTQEKEGLEMQIGDMKGGKEDFKEFCANLSAENEKLFGEISRMQMERDSVFEKQQEASKKLAASVKDLKNMEGKSEVLERQLSKLKREYQEQGRELGHCMKENEELKALLNQKEDSFSECKNEFRNIDIVNKDLEDQVFQLTNENQKLQTESNKMKSNKKQLETELKEKKLKISRLIETERILEEKLREITKVDRSGGNCSSNLQAELRINEELLEESIDKLSKLSHILRQILKIVKGSLQEVEHGKNTNEWLQEIDAFMQVDFGNKDECNEEKADSLLALLLKIQKALKHRVNDVNKYIKDIFNLVIKTKVRSEYPEIDTDPEKASTVELLNQTKMWLSWILKDYKNLCETPSQHQEEENIRNLKEIIIKYVVASTKQLEALFESVSEKNCIMMLLPTCKEQTESNVEKSNEDLLCYVRETFRANQMALEAAVGTLELVKLRGEADIITKGELEAKVNKAEDRELCQILKRMNVAVDEVTTKVQNMITNAEMIRTSSNSSVENGENQVESDENGMMQLQLRALKTLVSKRDKDISALEREVQFLKMEREQMLSELQEKNFDLGKLGDEVHRLDSSSTALESQLLSMKTEYEKASKELAERENELIGLKEKLSKQQDREGDAGELSSTESARSEIEKKELELKRLRSSLEDIRNVHCTNEDRIKTLQNKIEGVTHFLSRRESTIPEEEHNDNKEVQRSKKEHLLVVREIELKTSQAQFCEARDLKSLSNQVEQKSGDREMSEKLKSKEQENKYLQSVVKELKYELMSVQQGMRQEEESRSELNSMMGRQILKPFPRTAPAAGFENQKLRRRSMEYQEIRRKYRGDIDQFASDDTSVNSFTSPKHFGYSSGMPHDQFVHDCEICAMESVSGASTYICSDDDCDCNYASCEYSDTSFASDDEFERGRMVSPGFKGVYSKEARNISMQEATFAIKNQHRRHIRQTRDSPSLFHNPPSSPRQHVKQQPNEYEKPIAKYTVANLGRSNSGRTPSRPNSASSNYFQERRLAVERRSLERRPRSDGSSVYPKEFLSPQHESSSLKSSPSQHSSDECSSLSSGSGPCSGSGADCQHDCKKRHRLRGKLV